MLWIIIICWVVPLTSFAILAEYYFYCRKYKNQSIDKPECDVAYMPERKKSEYKKLCKNTKPVMLCKNCGANLNGRGKCEYCELWKMLDEFENAPTVEAEPIRHGHWEMCDEEYNAYRCSVCGDAWALEEGTPAENNMHYCHYCGAKMDEAEK